MAVNLESAETKAEVSAVIKEPTKALEAEENEDALPSPKEQREKIKSLEEKLDEVSEVCLIEIKWWEGWATFAGYIEGEDSPEEVECTVDPPGPIDNSSLADEEKPFCLKMGIQEKYNFKFVTCETYDQLAKWYGHDEKSKFTRPQVKERDNKVVKLQPFIIKVAVVGENGKAEKCEYKYFLREKTFAEIFSQMKEKLVKKEDRNMRLRLPFRIANNESYFSDNNPVPPDFDTELLTEITKENQIWSRKLEETEVQQGDTFEFETQNEDDTWYSAQLFNPENLRLGSVCEGLDKYSKWYHMQVVGVKIDENKTLFNSHWLGFKKTWNEMIPSTEHQKFAKMGSNVAQAKCKWYTPTKKNTGRHTSSSGFSSHRSSGGYGNSSGSSYSSSYGSGSYYRNVEGTVDAKGISGLRNIGNTCFMASVIQCLNQSPWFGPYFINNQYKKELNRDNPLGHKGKVAEKWAELQQALWSGKYSTVVPVEFKKTIGGFAPQFVGFQQQDSQELLNFLLDGLHEDLNRVHTKPYTQQIESGGRPDEVVAKESFANHQKRNESLVVDLLHGQLKSHVQCPKCSRVSVTFDPTSCLSVPVPTDENKLQVLTFMPWKAPADFRPMAYGVKVPKDATVKELKTQFVKQMDFDLDPKTLIVVEVYRGRVIKEWQTENFSTGKSSPKEDTFKVDRIQGPNSDDIFIFEIKPFNVTPEMKDDRESNLRVVKVYQRKPGNYSDMFGIPFPVVVDTAYPFTKAQLEKHIRHNITPFVELNRGESSMDAEIDYNSLFDFKWQQRVSKTTYSFKAQDWSNFKEEDIDSTDTVILAWKDKENYKEFHSEYRKRDQHESCRREERKGLSLQKCFDAFHSTEILTDDNLWYCSECKEHVAAQKTMSIWNSPDLLVIHLKRFKYTRYSRSKITTKVDYPIEGLDLTPYIADKSVDPKHNIYDLYGVSIHSGNLGGGHYTAYVKNRENKKWYNCNDTHTSDVSPSRVVTDQGYLLFYHRRNPVNLQKVPTGANLAAPSAGEPATEDAVED